MTTIEQKELKGITIRNFAVTIFSTVSIVVSVMASYYQLRADIHDVKTAQDTQSRVNELRLKILENNVAVLQQQVNQLKNQSQPKQL